ncbi:rRNA N6-adenosine-methyltransferase ZCCHC4-like [Gigantopelta aegis]|uniref:rRNA N6-adenosine-methyltransferase ZCCHC4-like n=1 Tax=Gigantopelta aegis TaxID=1735272 RepID=UPI001B88B783|nr:rRNA N6-adenosine-methyltransferase ZCCHC4-like [Gigantopelta aegis]
MAAKVTNIDVILNTSDFVVPSCPHGPALLFVRYDQSQNSGRKFFACSAFRDRKQCRFFQWADEKMSDKLQKVIEMEKQHTERKFSKQDLWERFQQFAELPKKDRHVCQSCGVFLLPSNQLNHSGQGHTIKHQIDDSLVRRPSQLFHPLNDNKTYAQYLFSEASVDFILKCLHALGASHVINIGTPRIHEAVVNDSSVSLSSLLLDLDQRFEQFYEPHEFCRYNMFNHHFFGGQEDRDLFDKFVAEGKDGKIVILIDPPFGGMVEALGNTLRMLMKQCKHGDSSVPVFWFFPYFMEKRITESVPEFSMLDYKVDYDNHALFKDKGGKKGSPVRIFTNLPPAEVELPPEEGYWFCSTCNRYSSKENKHCDECDSCTSKDGTTYVHCSICGVCVKPSRVHCPHCKTCQIPGHTCDTEERSKGCHICGDFTHKRRECPNKNKRKWQQHKSAGNDGIVKKKKKCKR